MLAQRSVGGTQSHTAKKVRRLAAIAPPSVEGWRAELRRRNESASGKPPTRHHGRELRRNRV